LTNLKLVLTTLDGLGCTAVGALVAPVKLTVAPIGWNASCVMFVFQGCSAARASTSYGFIL
jgi:hypothetical protein